MQSDCVATGSLAQSRYRLISVYQLAALVLAVAWSQLARAAAPCDDSQICGLTNAEDIVRLGETHWAIASRLSRNPEKASGFYLVDLKARKVTQLVTDDAGPADARFKACQGPVDPKKIITHGLDVHWRSNDHGELYAVNHGGRESIEVYDIRVNIDGPSLRWIGCVGLPDEILGNAVAYVPGGIAVTSFGERGDKEFTKLIRGEQSGFVAIWSPGNGWRHLANSRFSGDNGIAWNAGDNSLYVNGWGDGTLHIVPLGVGRDAVVIKLGDIHPDNAHFLPDGRLLIAGQKGNPNAIMACGAGSVCPADSVVVVFDTRTRKVLEKSFKKATQAFGASSSTLLFEHHYWGSSFLGDRLVLLGANSNE